MKKILFSLLLAFFTLTAFAEKTILVIGDSISAGYGINVEQGWVALLQNQLTEKNYDYTVVNASISGDTTSNGLARLPAALKQHQPAITIIELGGNDGLRGLQVATIKNNLQQMITLAKTAQSEVLLLGLRLPPNYGVSYAEQFQKMYADLASENNVAFVPEFLKGVDDKANLMQEDRIHPTVEAQIIIFKTLWPTLKGLLH